ncbi:MAG: hypothetical protein M3Z02_06880 [Actinomycetota bacterium]|nr:hypothetical protein [Actinomycetota bacterium]
MADPSEVGEPQWAGIRAVLAPYLLSRLLTVTALAVATTVSTAAGGTLHRHPGLTVYDASFYRDIARGGYSALPHEALRFFPLFPELARALDVVLPGPAGVATLVLANACALGYSLVLWRLVRTDLAHLDRTAGLADRSVWLLALAPAGFVLVLGYAESLTGLLAAGVFLAARRSRFGWAATLGLLAGLTRPAGALLAVPVLIEALRQVRSAGLRQWVLRAAATLAPVLGAGSYLLWAGRRYGDTLAPLRVQEQSGHRGGLVSLPFAPLKHSVIALVHGVEPTTAAHLLWTGLFGVLLVVSVRRLPASYSAFAAVMLAAAYSARTLDSLERYCFAAFPLLIALAVVVRRPQAMLVATTVFAATLTGYAVLAFLTLYTP